MKNFTYLTFLFSFLLLITACGDDNEVVENPCSVTNPNGFCMEDDMCLDGVCTIVEGNTKDKKIQFFLLTQNDEIYSDLNSIRFGFLEKSSSKSTYKKGDMKKFTDKDSNLSFNKRLPIIFNNNINADIPFTLNQDSLIGFFAPDHYKVSYVKSQMYDGSCAKPDFSEIDDMEKTVYDQVSTQDAKTLFTFKNLDIDFATDTDNFPHGKCLNFFWKIEKDASIEPDPNLVQQLSIHGNFGQFGFQDTTTKSIQKFNDVSDVGLRVGISEDYAGLLSEISLANTLADGTKEYKQILDILSPTDSGFHATAHIYKVQKNGKNFELAINQGSGSPYSKNGIFSFNWAFASKAKTVVNDERLQAIDWMPLYSDGTVNITDRTAVDTAPILNLKGEHFLNAKVEDYIVEQRGKIIDFTYKYKYKVSKDFTLDLSNSKDLGWLKPFLWFSQRVKNGENAKVYLEYPNSENVIDLANIQDASYRKKMGQLNCSPAGKGCFGSENSWKCLCQQDKDQNLKRMIFEYDLDSGEKVALEISAKDIIPNENSFIKANFSISTLNGFTRTLIRLQPETYSKNFLKDDEFSQKYILRVGKKEDLDEDYLSRK